MKLYYQILRAKIEIVEKTCFFLFEIFCIIKYLFVA